MDYRQLPLRVSQIVAVIVAGIGLGIGADRYWSMERSEPLLALAGPGPLRSDPARPSGPGAAEPDPAAPATAGTRHALLIGVTKYDNLPRDRSLEGRRMMLS